MDFLVKILLKESRFFSTTPPLPSTPPFNLNFCPNEKLRTHLFFIPYIITAIIICKRTIKKLKGETSENLNATMMVDTKNFVDNDIY